MWLCYFWVITPSTWLVDNNSPVAWNERLMCTKGFPISCDSHLSGQIPAVFIAPHGLTQTSRGLVPAMPGCLQLDWHPGPGRLQGRGLPGHLEGTETKIPSERRFRKDCFSFPQKASSDRERICVLSGGLASEGGVAEWIRPLGN